MGLSINLLDIKYFKRTYNVRKVLNVYQTSIKNNVLSISATIIGSLELSKTSLWLSTSSEFECFNPPLKSFVISNETRFSFACVLLGLATELISALLLPLMFTVYTIQITNLNYHHQT